MLTCPPKRPTHVAAFGIMIWTLDAFSAPGFYTEFGIIAALLWMLLIGIWSLRLIVSLISGHSLRRWQWTIVPIIGVLTLVMLSFEVPMYIRFAISRRDLTRLAQQAIAAGPKTLPARGTGTIKRAGAYDVIAAQVKPVGEVDFIVPGTFFMRSCSGFTYDATGSPSDPEGSFEPLGGSWYVWHTSW
jgi:hypothetical protein